MTVFKLVMFKRNLGILYLQTNKKPLYFLKSHFIELPSGPTYKLNKKSVSKITAHSKIVSALFT